MPDAAITTDIIVGFPGETEADFQATLDVVRAARFASAFTFQYSKRPGTPAADMDGQVPKEVVQERYDRLLACVEEVTWAENRRLIGSTVEVLVAAGEGRKDGATGRMSGRARDGRLVHFGEAREPNMLQGGEAREPNMMHRMVGDAPVRPGDVVHATVTYAAPHHLNADGPLVAHRRTRAGDAWEATGSAPPLAGSAPAAAGSAPATPSVMLGLPARRS
jgi:tRNA-2-methylthio-N6-dimethylallyladenosine synthase